MKKVIVEVTKEEIDSGLATFENIEKVVKLFMQDTSWTDLDFRTTSEQLNYGLTNGFGYIDYEAIKSGIINTTNCLFADKECQEIIDLTKEEIELLHKEFGTEVFSLREALDAVE